MTMQKRHFEFIAKTLKSERDGYGDFRDRVIDALSLAFASELSFTNAQFDRARFLAACGVREDRALSHNIDPNHYRAPYVNGLYEDRTSYIRRRLAVRTFWEGVATLLFIGAVCLFAYAVLHH